MSKKVFVIVLLTVLALGVVALLPAAAQEGERWVGADDLPTNPLECPADAPGAAMAAEATAEATMEAEATEAAAPAYNGGQPVNPPDKAGQPITLVDIPKLIGIGYFNATSKGMQEAAAELGNVTVTTDGPTQGDITQQVAFIEQYITQGVDGILFAANDPVGISPVLRRALEQGIHVVGYDANSEPDAREWFVNQAEFNGIAKAMIDSMAAEIGPDGTFAIVTSSFTAPNQSRWIAEMQAYAAKCYPDLTWLETVESQEDQNLAFQQTQTLINKYGADMDGVFGMSSVAFPGAADAVTQANLCQGVASDEDAVHVVGLSTPNQMRPFVESGCVKSVVLWNPVDLGYAAVYVMRAVVDGTLTPESTSVEAGRLGTLQVVNGSEILLGPPFIYTQENIADFDF
ncbi:MAG: substrate-binding domain-containing protein [Chloroflexi bacterium]|nr:substrate-binding domain-containing protein [Chloroflexota bacterium]